MFKVPIGDAKEVERIDRIRESLWSIGFASEVREHHKRSALYSRLPFRAFGHAIVVGGPRPLGTERGWRYVVTPHVDVAAWVNWRKAKRMIRRGEVRLAHG